MDFVELGDVENAFTRGGNRLCFVDPRNHRRCIKVLRPDRSPEIRRRQKPLFKRWRSLQRFDENWEEFNVWKTIEQKIGPDALQLIGQCFGWVKTEFGLGLVMELICDDDGKISKTLKQYLWEEGLTSDLKAAVENFAVTWVRLGMPSKKLLLHNMLVQSRKVSADENHYRVYVIDGLGWSSFLPLAKFIPSIAKLKAQQKIDELWETIEELVTKKQLGVDFGYHGWLSEAQRQINRTRISNE